MSHLMKRAMPWCFVLMMSAGLASGGMHVLIIGSTGSSYNGEDSNASMPFPAENIRNHLESILTNKEDYAELRVTLLDRTVQRNVDGGGTTWIGAYTLAQWFYYPYYRNDLSRKNYETEVLWPYLRGEYVEDGQTLDWDHVIPLLPATYATWAGGTFSHAFTNIAMASNPDCDWMNNLMEFAMGTDPTTQDTTALATDGSSHGYPSVQVDPDNGTVAFYFIRRKDHGTAGSVNYMPRFSIDLLQSFDVGPEHTPEWVADSIADPSNYEVMKVPYPAETRFGRIQVSTEP